MLAARLLGCLTALTLNLNAVGQELSSLNTVAIRDIVVSGDLIPRALLEDLLPRYRNRNVSADELLQLAKSLTEYLVAQGYINSGVILPDQKVEDGVVRLETIVGRVDRVTVTGNNNISYGYIDARLGDLQSGAFNVNRAVESLKLLERDPLIRRINAELKPSVERGQALLNIQIEEVRAYGASVGVDNNISPNVGAGQVFVDAHHRSALGVRDTIAINYRNAEGYESGSGEYRIPINARDTTIGLRYAMDSSRIVTEPFAALDIRGESQRYGISVRHPFINDLDTEFSLALGAHKETVRSYLLGEPFSFSTSDSEGVSTAVMAQFMQEWVRHSVARVIALRSTFNVGLDVWDASVGGPADGEFVEWFAHGEWLESISWRRSTLSLRLQAHLANDELPSYRKYSLGGANSVRGYRENVLTRDNGVLASLGWTVPALRVPLSWLNFGARGSQDARATGELSLTPFIDYGRGWNVQEGRGDAVELIGAGVALRWNPAPNSGVELQYAKSLRAYDTLTFERVLQDDGIYFSVRIGL